MDADQRKKLETYKANTSELSKFISYFFAALIVSGMVGFYLLNLGAENFDWGLRNFAVGWLPRLVVFIPILLVTLFPVMFAYNFAKYLMNHRYLGDLIILVLVYVCLAVNFVASAFLVSANLGYLVQVGWYGRTLAAIIFIYLLSKVVMMYAQATRKGLPPGVASSIAENSSILEKIMRRIGQCAAVLLLSLLLAPLAVRLFQLIINK